MINPKELQFGNFILDDEGCLVRVCGFEPHSHSVRCDEPEGCKIIVDIYRIDGKIKKGYECESNSCSPIELNTHLLEVLCGFEKKIILGNSSGYWYVLNGLSYNESHKGWWFRGSFPNGPKYLHELQNLYYWLNKQELIIKTDSYVAI